MKKSFFIGIAVIAVAIAVIISASGDVTTYATFEQAAQTGNRVKLVGQLVKEKPVEYNPEVNPDLTRFWLRDESGQEVPVVLYKGKPQDFERSEKIVLTGEVDGEVFEASDILLKCPSKYKDQESYIRDQEEAGS